MLVRNLSALRVRGVTHRLALSLLVLVSILVGAGPAMAADSSFTVFGGALAGGKLYKAVSQDSRVWLSPDGRQFPGVEIRAEIEETAIGGLRFQKAMGDRWGFGGTFAMGDADVSVLQRTVAPNVEKVDWDQILIVNTEVTAFYDLLPDEQTPYLIAGAGLSLWSGEGASGLDQTAPSVVLGAGYRIRGFGFDIDLEIRDSLVFSDFDDERARLEVDDGDFETFDPTHVWSITAGWAYVF